ncbi:MAG: YkgJ family cysteine cluster protein [Candidatus Woesearchaeota archaeon]
MKSKLASSEICQKCAKCCTTFCWTEGKDMAQRFAWLKDKKIIEVKDTPFNNHEIILHIPCAKLTKIGDKYSCSVWNKKRPEFCETFPDHLFNGINKNERKKIQNIINWARADCPVFENMTVDDIVQKLF